MYAKGRGELRRENEYWKAVMERNREYDGKFVFAVRTTGVFCRPSCSARHPRRENVRFFSSPAEAKEAKFRACQRCRPDEPNGDEPHLDLMRQVCDYLSQAQDKIPTLEELGQQFNLSPFHLQRTFKRFVGVTPHQYAMEKRAERLKAGLKNGVKVTDAIYQAGYQSSSSVYEQSTEQLGMTPAEYQRGGNQTHIMFTVTPCPLGWLLVARTEKGICAVRLGDLADELEKTLREEFPAARIERNEGELGGYVKPLLDYLSGCRPHLDLPLDVQATAFQRRVWDALRTIPYGSTRTYQALARTIGDPGAVRAVAHACAKNPAALVIPCHRVVRSDGDLAGYRWGIERKRALLEQEAKAGK